MNTDNTRDAAEPSPASAGSHGEPVAWFIHADGWEMVSLFREHADAAAEENDAEVSPLYTRPQPALTDKEREAFKLAAEWCRASGGAVYDAGHAIDRFLERTK